MREIHSSSRRRRKKRSGGCFGKFITFLLLSVLLIMVGYKAFHALGVKTRFLQTQYPMKYQSFVEKYAAEFSLEKELVYAIIRTESKFDPYAVSTTGAKGLMQIQEETAQDCAKDLKMENFSLEALFDPEINIRLGCYYFSKLLKRYKGNIQLSVAAYNGGPGNVEKWLRDEAYTNEKGELVHIPFPETKNYVVRVTEAYEKYCAIYSGSQ